jgi:hypothetical protein
LHRISQRSARSGVLPAQQIALDHDIGTPVRVLLINGAGFFDRAVAAGDDYRVIVGGDDIGSDNGVSLASPNGLFNLSKPSV